MELLFISLGGAIIGLLARYLLPHRQFHGSILVPALGAAVAAVLWVSLTWAGMAWDGGWIWTIAFLVTAIVCVVVDLVLGVRRKRDDHELLRELSKRAIPQAA